MSEPRKTSSLAPGRLSLVLSLLISLGYAISGVAAGARPEAKPSLQTQTAIALNETCDLDFPAGRCGGHANTGVRWTAPQAATVSLEGKVWKIRERGIPVELSLWVKGRKLIDRALIRGKSSAPYSFARLLAEQKREPTALKNLQLKAGDEIYVQMNGNDFVGLDLTIGKWDLAADFSQQSNPAGPWAYGTVIVDGSGRPGLRLFEARTTDFDPEDFGQGQPSWSSKQEGMAWYWSLMKSKGVFCRQEIRFTSGQTLAVEAITRDRYVGRYWSADGRINLPREGWAVDAFLLELNGEVLSNGWRYVSAGELPKTERGARHYVVELANASRPLTVKVHTLLDGTPVLTRWLELRNQGAAPVALTKLAPWSGQLWPGQAFSLGYFTRQDWSFEGWFEWKPVPLGVTAVTCDQARSHDDPFFIVRNDATGEYFIGHLAWTTDWKMEFERNEGALLFRIGPAADAALRVIAPGEAIQSPAVHLGHVSGDLDEAVQAMHDHLRRFVLPTRPPKRSHLIQYLVPADQGYYLPFDEASALKCVEVAAAIGAELFILDYGWWDITGDWVPSASRFPRGLDPLIDAVHRKGMLFGLYVRAEGDSGDIVSSKMGRAHPDWIGPSSTVKLQIPEAAQWVESEICRMVQEFHLDLYRLDYNPSFKFGTTLRDGFTENDCWRYYDAFYSTYGRIHQKYPNLILQQAAAGGARNDLGTVSRFHEPYLTDGLWLPRELQIYSGLTLGLPPENFVILHLAHGGVATGLPQRLDTILRMSYATSTPQIFVGIVAPSVETLTPQRRERFLHYGKIYREFIRPLLPTCKLYHHEPINAHGGVTSSGWFAIEYASPDHSKGWALVVRTGDTKSDIYQLIPRGLDVAKTYRVTWDSRQSSAKMAGARLMLEGLPIRLEDVASSELLLFEAQ